VSNPFVAGSTATTTSNLPLYQEYAWDFVNNCFIFQNGQQQIVYGNDALRVWVYKALQTERYRYQAYDSAYGLELEQFISQPNSAYDVSQVETYIAEGLLVNPYITSVDYVSYSINEDSLSITVSLTTIYGQLSVSS